MRHKATSVKGPCEKEFTFLCQINSLNNVFHTHLRPRPGPEVPEPAALGEHPLAEGVDVAVGGAPQAQDGGGALGVAQQGGVGRRSRREARRRRPDSEGGKRRDGLSVRLRRRRRQQQQQQQQQP